ncbi:MAG: ABC transporter ATP-binding protein [Acidimicrobiales bacterium]
MGEPAVVVDGLWKRFRVYHERNQYLKASVMRGRRARYEEFWALRDVSFEVAAGEFFGIVGPNGSGKSTMLKCLAKILRPDKGDVRVNGKLSALLELGAGFHPELSGRENVFLNAAILGLGRKEIERRFDEIVAFSGLEQFIDTPVKNYSSGMYAKLGFAVAINVDPEVLVIDEVLAVGDAAFQQKCAEKFSELRGSGRTIVLVTHDLGSVRALCDRAVWLRAGHVVADGDPYQIVNAYADEMLGAGRDDHHETGRWGTGEIRANAVRILDAAGASVTRCFTDEPFEVELSVEAHVPVPRPVFAVEISHLSGTVVTAPSTRDAEVVPELFSGGGTVRVRIDRLPLLPGTYDLTVSIRDESLHHTYDHRQQVLRFDVLTGAVRESAGLVTFHPRWTVPGA